MTMMVTKCRRGGAFGSHRTPGPSIQRSERDNEKYKQFIRNHEFFHKRQYFIPQLKYTSEASASPIPGSSREPPPLTTSDGSFHIRGLDIITLEHVGNPNLLFGQPYSGKTSLFLKLCLTSTSRFSSKHWIRFVEMRDLADLVRSLPKRPKSFLHLLAIHLKTTEKELKQIFKPIPFPKFKKAVHRGELFLDGFDEIPAIERDYFWRLIPQLKCGKGECAIRIWISCRSYVKQALSKVFPEHGHFDIVKYSAGLLVDLLHQYWKLDCFPNMSKEKDDRMLLFAQNLHSELKMIIPNFDSGIGCLPMCIELVASLFSHHLSLFLGSDDGNPKIQQPKIYFTDLVGKCVLRMIECYCFKLTAPDEVDLELANKEFPKIIELYSDYALKTHPSYVYPLHMAMAHPNGPETGSSHQHVVHITEELHRIGLLVKNDLGNIEFHHKTLGDYLLAKYFEYKGMYSSEKCEPDFDQFYFREVLFEQQEGPGILSYYDYFLGQQNPNHYSEFLHDFLVKHYKLGKGQEEEWEKIKDNGNVWHLVVMQRYNNVARRFLKAFKVEESSELRRFLMMRVPLGVLEGNDLQTINACPESVRNQHVVSSLSILALFGYDSFVEQTLDIFLQLFEPEELQLEFNKQREWSPIHYAATHANLWFINGVYGSKFHTVIQIQPGIYNPGGFLPTHLLLTGAWYYYVMKMKDCNLSAYLDSTFPTDAELSGGVKEGRKNKDMGMRGFSNDGGERGESSKNSIDAAEQGDDDCRGMYKDGFMRKDWHGVPGLMQTLHKCIQMMVKVGGEDINAFDMTRRTTLLHRVVEEGLLETTMFLINMEPRLEINVRNIHGFTPIHHAGGKGFKSIFLCLARHGGKPTLRNNMSQSAISMWRESGEKIYFRKNGPALTKPEIEFFDCAQHFDTLVTMSNAYNSREMKWTECVGEAGWMQRILELPDENPDNNLESGREDDAPPGNGDCDDNQAETTEAEEGQEEAIEEEKEPTKCDEWQDTEAEEEEVKEPMKFHEADEGEDTEVDEDEDDGEGEEEDYYTSTEALDE